LQVEERHCRLLGIYAQFEHIWGLKDPAQVCRRSVYYSHSEQKQYSTLPGAPLGALTG
jgi:hypothetical protein